MPGRYRNGMRVAKVRTEKGDIRPVGATGTVLGSISQPKFCSLYFIEWDDTPRHAVGVVDWKVQPLQEQ